MIDHVLSRTRQLLFIPLILFAAATLFGQDGSSGFIISIDYMNAPSGQEYVEMEKTIYKPIHEHAVRNGKKIGWILYEIVYPYGEDTRYNYATVNFYADSKQAFDMSWSDFTQVFNEVHPTLDMIEIEKMTNRTRHLVSGEMFALVDEAIVGPSGTPAEYISVNHMVVKPGMDQEYIGMELEIFKPLHQQRIKEGNAVDWFLFRRMFPYGAEFGYQYVTVDAHGTVEQMTTPNSNETWSTVHPDLDANEYFEKMEGIRTLKRQETWRLVDYTFGTEN